MYVVTKGLQIVAFLTIIAYLIAKRYNSTLAKQSFFPIVVAHCALIEATLAILKVTAIFPMAQGYASIPLYKLF